MAAQDLSSKQKMGVELIGAHLVVDVSFLLTVVFCFAALESLIKSYFQIVKKNIQDR